MLCGFTSYFTNVTENDNSMAPSIARGSIYTYVSHLSWVKLLFPLLGVIFNIFINVHSLGTNQNEAPEGVTWEGGLEESSYLLAGIKIF